MNVATETPSFANRPPLATPPDPLAARVDALRKIWMVERYAQCNKLSGL